MTSIINLRSTFEGNEPNKFNMVLPGKHFADLNLVEDMYEVIGLPDPPDPPAYRKPADRMLAADLEDMCEVIDLPADLGLEDVCEVIVTRKVKNFSVLKNKFYKLIKEKGLSEHIGYRFAEAVGIVVFQFGINVLFNHLGAHLSAYVLLSPQFEMIVDQTTTYCATVFCLGLPVIAWLIEDDESDDDENDKLSTTTQLVSAGKTNASEQNLNVQSHAIDLVESAIGRIDKPIPKFFYALRNSCMVAAACLGSLALIVGVSGLYGGTLVYFGVMVLRLVVMPMIVCLSRVIGPVVDKIMASNCQHVQITSLVNQIFWATANITVFPALSYVLEQLFYCAVSSLCLSVLMQAVIIGAIWLASVLLIFFASYRIWKNVAEVSK